MNLKSISAAVLAAAIVVFATTAQAARVMDTGEPPAPGFGNALVGSGPQENRQFQYLANALTLNSAHEIDAMAVALHFNATFNLAGSFTMALYSDVANAPGERLFASDPVEVASSFAGGWVGLEGLDWSVGAGRYWFAIEAQGSPISIIASYAANLPEDFAFRGGIGAGQPWDSSLPGSVSMRVDATPLSAVPEPAAWLMMGLGLAGMALRVLRRA